MKMCKNDSGYLYFSLYNQKLKKTKFYSQRRFVFEVFKSPIPKYF